MIRKDDLISDILARMYYKPTLYYNYYLGITGQRYERIRNLKSWLKRQKLETLNEIYGRL